MLCPFFCLFFFFFLVVQSLKSAASLTHFCNGCCLFCGWKLTLCVCSSKALWSGQSDLVGGSSSSLFWPVIIAIWEAVGVPEHPWVLVVTLQCPFLGSHLTQPQSPMPRSWNMCGWIDCPHGHEQNWAKLAGRRTGAQGSRHQIFVLRKRLGTLELHGKCSDVNTTVI